MDTLSCNCAATARSTSASISGQGKWGETMSMRFMEFPILLVNGITKSSALCGFVARLDNREMDEMLPSVIHLLFGPAENATGKLRQLVGGADYPRSLSSKCLHRRGITVI